ncbi:sodium-dependent dicarboxylate transporter 2/3/5 [Lewinella marina]|uniref:Anion transporter n=1 Tax=Neolewinella marina TaxID=438751 RepID=A0A2G0CJW5_9BACT|nr:SLC13 family permease [Neolewinella marina]NJB84554.1 sodium-dependent dicarboxylate transporter 2/3/5 [Neolewinella marina]PHL00264.1 anion transporter [Neolewinella marina]
MNALKNPQRIGLFLGPALFLLTLFFYHPEGMSVEANAVLASTLWVAAWWITEAIPIAATSLLPIVLFPLTGALGLDETTASYGHKYIFLYIGGFILAIAIERWNLHRRLALNIIALIGTNVNRILLGFMTATAFLSMWISNTASSVMMLPIGAAIIKQLRDNPNTIEDENKTFGKLLMLGIAYSASIGGIATLIGTPPNLILAGIVQELYGIEISFQQWIIIGLPISVILLLICWRYLAFYTRNFEQRSFPGGKREIANQLSKLGKIGYEEKTVLIVFSLTAFAWITRGFLLERFLPGLDDTIIAIAAGLILFLLPARRGSQRAIVTWEEAVQLPWGILLLFGGGLAIAQAFKVTGLAEWMATQLMALEGVSLLVLLLVLVAAVNFLTEITSNLATTAMLLPVLASLALTVDVHPFILMVGATVAASCAFMLPVATPPNAVVFGSGYLTIPDMVRAGVVLNVISIFLLTAFVYFVLPYAWSFEPNAFPLEWLSGAE